MTELFAGSCIPSNKKFWSFFRKKKKFLILTSIELFQIFNINQKQT